MARPSIFIIGALMRNTISRFSVKWESSMSYQLVLSLEGRTSLRNKLVLIQPIYSFVLLVDCCNTWMRHLHSTVATSRLVDFPFAPNFTNKFGIICIFSSLADSATILFSFMEIIFPTIVAS